MVPLPYSIMAAGCPVNRRLSGHKSLPEQPENTRELLENLRVERRFMPDPSNVTILSAAVPEHSKR